MIHEHGTGDGTRATVCLRVRTRARVPGRAPGGPRRATARRGEGAKRRPTIEPGPPAEPVVTAMAFGTPGPVSSRGVALARRAARPRPGRDRVPAHLIHGAPAHRAGAARPAGPGGRLLGGDPARDAGRGDRVLRA